MAPNQTQSLRGLLLTHELAFLVLVAVAGALGGVWAYFWQQTSAESIRLNGLAHVAQEIRSDLFRQVKEATLARLRDDPAAAEVHSEYTRMIKSGFNQLRRRSVSRGEAYAVQSLQQAYSKIQVDMNAIFEDPYLLNRIVRSKLLDPRYEEELVGEFETAFRNLRGLINQQLDEQERQIARWTRFAPLMLPVPIIIAIILLLFSRASLMGGFVRPVQSVVAAIRRISGGDLSARVEADGVSEVGEIARGIADMALQLESSRDALVDNERQAALGALVPVIAHNIRNPLASIRASAQLLDRDASGAELIETKVGIIETVDRLERWVSGLVSYLHPLQPQCRRVPATALFDAAAMLLAPRFEEKSIRLARQPWDVDAEVDVDPDLMEQALDALLSNALDASAPGATITLSVTTVADEVILGIADNGGGIPFAPEPDGLEPGPTTKKMGTGLGIPIAFKVCKAHAWNIAFDIDSGVGTKVTITAPRGLRVQDHDTDPPDHLGP